MCEHLALTGAVITDLYYCLQELDPPCVCRKSEPGMLLQPAHAYNVALAISRMISDSKEDAEARKRASFARTGPPNILRTHPAYVHPVIARGNCQNLGISIRTLSR
jgi:histidinol phosphatase-like enzyme